MRLAKEDQRRNLKRKWWQEEGKMKGKERVEPLKSKEKKKKKQKQ